MAECDEIFDAALWDEKLANVEPEMIFAEYRMLPRKDYIQRGFSRIAERERHDCG